MVKQEKNKKYLKHVVAYPAVAAFGILGGVLGGMKLNDGKYNGIPLEDVLEKDENGNLFNTSERIMELARPAVDGVSEIEEYHISKNNEFVISLDDYMNDTQLHQYVNRLNIGLDSDRKSLYENIQSEVNKIRGVYEELDGLEGNVCIPLSKKDIKKLEKFYITWNQISEGNTPVYDKKVYTDAVEVFEKIDKEIQVKKENEQTDTQKREEEKSVLVAKSLPTLQKRNERV